jgi:hypothetical protein
MNILNLYASLNGNTQKIARTVAAAAEEAGHTVRSINLKQDAEVIDLLEYDLTFIGSGVYTWLPDKSVLKWIDKQLAWARKDALIKPGSPRIPWKFACVYCTYAGPHTGEAEATPAIKYMGQLFDHLGITVADEWSIPGAFVPEKMTHFNTTGRLGNIEGRPNAEDLRQVCEKTLGLLANLKASVKQ